MSTVVLYCWCHCDGASVLLYFRVTIVRTLVPDEVTLYCFAWFGRICQVHFLYHCQRSLCHISLSSITADRSLCHVSFMFINPWYD